MKNFKKFAFASMLAMMAIVPASAQIFYKVEKDGSDKTSYLLGTHHFAPLAVVDSIQELPSILARIDRLYGEVDMQAMSDPAVLMGMQQLFIAPADSTLDRLLTVEQLDSVKVVWDRFAEGAMPFEMLKMMKPSLISTQLASMMAMKTLPDLNPLEGIDITMQNRARELGKPVGGLETVEFQLDMLYNQPLEKQAQALMETVRNADTYEEKAAELTNAYLSHDIQKILDLMVEAENDDPEAIEKMLYARNENWISQLAAEMPQESLMVVVGAGHLPGERGVIEGLRKAGFTVTPIK